MLFLLRALAYWYICYQGVLRLNFQKALFTEVPGYILSEGG